LAQMIIDGNIETLKNYKIKKILTHCPHCYNTLKSEYPSFGASGTPGADFQVVHHSQFLAQLLEEKRLTIKEPLQQKMVLHDSCYLGRYHEIYTPPRDVIQAANGKKSLEMQRRCSESFCCGAGGGRMWLEENLGSRINILRTEQALETGADTIGVACPYCLTMLEDGIKSKDLEDTHRVMDLAEMLLKACK